MYFADGLKHYLLLHLNMSLCHICSKESLLNIVSNELLYCYKLNIIIILDSQLSKLWN